MCHPSPNADPNLRDFIIGTPEQTLELLKDAMEEEMNSVTTCLRNTFLNR